VAVNCGAIPHELVDSAFFGHRKGAFTGADRDRSGYFALSDGGTLFLDELGELPLPAQARLLRVLETGTYWPVGGTAEQRCDVRVVAATNRELEAMTADGTFRDDLFYRVAQVRIPVPPLRERLEDIPVLVEHFLAGAPIHFEARRLLMSYHWPGNVRELRNELERAVALRGDEEIDVSLFSPTVQAARGKSAEEATGELPVFRSDLKAYLDGIERRVVGEVLAHCEGNLTQAAKRLGVSRHGLRKKLLRLGLRS
jgi:transcriptional regulator with PAS, ATPase and Fis domain